VIFSNLGRFTVSGLKLPSFQGHTHIGGGYVGGGGNMESWSNLVKVVNKQTICRLLRPLKYDIEETSDGQPRTHTRRPTVHCHSH
jgi:hypothetical protein